MKRRGRLRRRCVKRGWMPWEERLEEEELYRRAFQGVRTRERGEEGLW